MKPFLFLLIPIFLLSCQQAQEPTSKLDKILETGKIRVGTPGDYKPFTFLENTGEYTGIDIDLAHDLANSLNAEVEFVATSWPTLIEDLKADKFDIAMGGISKKLSRQQVGFLSDAYAIGGKTPIARCEDTARFSTLAEIDQAETRVIVNPGGTNQQFADTHIKNASIKVFKDNREIFKEIAEGRADIMITDSWEVQLQSKLIPELCPAMPGKTFDQFEKTLLMPRDIVWKEYVNAWLREAELSGRIEAVFSRHL